MATSENFDNVELTEQEIRELIEKATHEKRRKLKEQAYRESLLRPVSIPDFDASTYLKWCIARWEKLYQKKWITTDENKQITMQLACYFAQDETFEEKEGYSLKKGILLAGGVGVGKTTLMQLFGRNPLSSFIIVPCRNIANEYVDYGNDMLDKYTSEYLPSSDNPFQHNTFGLCFDDLGTETRKRNYGNELNVLEEIILTRYERRQTLQNKTHITTNLTGDSIGEMYGERVRSRMREMFNIIVFDGSKDMRM